MRKGFIHPARNRFHLNASKYLVPLEKLINLIESGNFFSLGVYCCKIKYYRTLKNNVILLEEFCKGNFSRLFYSDR